MAEQQQLGAVGASVRPVHASPASVRPPVAVARRTKEPGWRKTNNNLVRSDSLLDGLILVWGERVLEK